MEIFYFLVACRIGEFLADLQGRAGVCEEAIGDRSKVCARTRQTLPGSWARLCVRVCVWLCVCVRVRDVHRCVRARRVRVRVRVCVWSTLPLAWLLHSCWLILTRVRFLSFPPPLGCPWLQSATSASGGLAGLITRGGAGANEERGTTRNGWVAIVEATEHEANVRASVAQNVCLSIGMC